MKLHLVPLDVEKRTGNWSLHESLKVQPRVNQSSPTPTQRIPRNDAVRSVEKVAWESEDEVAGASIRIASRRSILWWLFAATARPEASCSKQPWNFPIQKRPKSIPHFLLRSTNIFNPDSLLGLFPLLRTPELH